MGRKEINNMTVSAMSVTVDNIIYILLIYYSIFSALKRKLMMRRSLHELVDQGIYPRKYFSKKQNQFFRFNTAAAVLLLKFINIQGICFEF